MLASGECAFHTCWVPLNRIEWDFDNVPDDELAACRLWEYARESRSFAISSARKLDIEKSFADDQQTERKLNSDYEAFLESYWNCREGYMTYYETIRNYGGPHSLPWQLISPDVRGLLKSQVGVPELGGPLVLAMLCQLEKVFKDNVKEWKAVQNQPGYDPKEDGIGYESSQPYIDAPGYAGEPQGETVATFAVDFRNYNNKEICASFIGWLKANRPKSCPEPSGRGRKLRDLRVALDRLGIMRLLHNFTLGEIPNYCPDAWKAFAGFDWYKERKRAGIILQKLFPFLLKVERPLSWPTKGGRSG
jgi:hypothetical protein